MVDRLSRVGQQLGNYRLLRLLGEGGFAEVYLGKHTHLGTYAAVKILHAQVTQSDIAQFQREARMLANLTHPHIVRVLDFGIESRTPYLVIDYAPNGTLRTSHPKGTRLAVPTVVSYVKQCARALQYAHDQKIIHRDVKPENMLVGRNGEILLSDFGIALITQSSLYQGTKDMAGTIAYMAPEQIEAHPRPASDQYSLGIVVYEWFSGNRPFHGSCREIAIKHSVTSPPSLCQQRSDLSPEIEQVVLTALAKKPENRFTSVLAFATALERASQLRRSRPLSATVPATPSHQSSQSIRGILPANHPSAPGQARQPEHTQLSVPLPVATSPSQPPSPTVPTTSPPLSLDPTTGVSSHSLTSVSDASQGPNTQQPIPHRMTGRLSRRTVIVGLAGLALVGSGITWFAISRSSNTNTYQGHSSALYTYRGHSDTVKAVAWSPDGKRIASASNDHTVQVREVTDGGYVFTYKGHSEMVKAVVWSPDGKYIASASDDHTVQVWDAGNGGHVYTYKGHADQVWAVAWSPDGKRIASGSNDTTVQVWDAVDGGNVFTYKGHAGAALAIAWSPDGKRIASGFLGKTVQVWDAVNGGNAITYKGHDDWVWAVAWSPDGKRIVSGSNDTTVQVWDAMNGGNVFTYKGRAGLVYTVAWSPDGKRIVSGSSNGTVQVWAVS